MFNDKIDIFIKHIKKDMFILLIKYILLLNNEK
jgi:hypothetical protein